MDYDDLDPYHTVDLFVGVRDEAGRWDAGIFARNLFDEDEKIRAQAPGLHRREPTGYQGFDLVAPRLLGARMSWNF